MKLYKIAFIGVAVLALAACNKELGGTADFTSEEQSEIVFVTRAAEVGTRATEVTTASLTTFNVIATSGTTTQTSVWTDGVFSGTSGGNFTGGKYWPQSSVSWNFYASNAAMTFASTGCTIAVADCNTDVVAEYLQGAVYKTSNALTFDHILCQIGTVTMKAPAGYTVSDLRVTLNPIYSGTFDMKGNSWTRGNASQTASYIVGTQATGAAISTPGGSYTQPDNDLWLVPGQYQLEASYRIAKGDWNNTYTKHATVTLQQGMNNNLGLPGVNHDEPNIPDPSDDVADIIFTVTVTPWGNVDVPANFN